MGSFAKKIINESYRTKKKLAELLDLEEWAFKKAYKQINQVPGYLKSPRQEKWFFNTARNASDNAVIVEIGSFLGRSTVSFGLGLTGKDQKIYAIDLFEGDGEYYGDGDFETMFRQNLELCGVTDKVEVLRGHSLEVGKEWDKPIDVLFIDGSHEYEDVKADFEIFYPYVKTGGIIAFHDIKGKWEGAIRFWNEQKEENMLIDFKSISSLGFAKKI